MKRHFRCCNIVWNRYVNSRMRVFAALGGACWASVWAPCSVSTRPARNPDRAQVGPRWLRTHSPLVAAVESAVLPQTPSAAGNGRSTLAAAARARTMEAMAIAQREQRRPGRTRTTTSAISTGSPAIRRALRSSTTRLPSKRTCARPLSCPTCSLPVAKFCWRFEYWDDAKGCVDTRIRACRTASPFFVGYRHGVRQSCGSVRKRRGMPTNPPKSAPAR